jgi:hypothetical protein
MGYVLVYDSAVLCWGFESHRCVNGPDCEDAARLLRLIARLIVALVASFVLTASYRLRILLDHHVIASFGSSVIQLQACITLSSGFGCNQHKPHPGRPTRVPRGTRQAR